MDLSTIEDAGLTRAEAQVYLAVLELGKTRSGPIIARTGLQSSVVFVSLHALVRKGLISTVKIGARNAYLAADPNALLDVLDERRRRLSAALPELQLKKQLTQTEGAELYEGIAGLQTMFLSMIADARKGEEFLYFDAEGHGQEDRAKIVYVPFHAKCKAQGVVLRGIQRESSTTKKAYQRSVHLVLTTEAIPPDTSIFRDKIALVTWSETPKGVLITAPQLAQQYRTFWPGFQDRARRR